MQFFSGAMLSVCDRTADIAIVLNNSTVRPAKSPACAVASSAMFSGCDSTVMDTSTIRSATGPACQRCCVFRL